MQKQEVPKTSFGDLIIIRNGTKTISLQTLFRDLIIIIIIIKRNGAKTRNPQNFVCGLHNKKRCKNNKSPNFVWGLNNNNKKKRCKNNKSPSFVWGLNDTNKKWCKNNKFPRFVWGLNNNNKKKQSKSNMSHKLRLEAIMMGTIKYTWDNERLFIYDLW